MGLNTVFYTHTTYTSLIFVYVCLIVLNVTIFQNPNYFKQLECIHTITMNEQRVIGIIGGCILIATGILNYKCYIAPILRHTERMNAFDDRLKKVEKRTVE